MRKDSASINMNDHIKACFNVKWTAASHLLPHTWQGEHVGRNLLLQGHPQHSILSLCSTSKVHQIPLIWHCMTCTDAVNCITSPSLTVMQSACHQIHYTLSAMLSTEESRGSTIVGDEVALAHGHGVHAQARGHVLDQVLRQHSRLDLARAAHCGVRGAVAAAEVQVEVELWEGVCLQGMPTLLTSNNQVLLQHAPRCWGRRDSPLPLVASN